MQEAPNATYSVMHVVLVVPVQPTNLLFSTSATQAARGVIPKAAVLETRKDAVPPPLLFTMKTARDVILKAAAPLTVAALRIVVVRRVVARALVPPPLIVLVAPKLQ